MQSRDSLDQLIMENIEMMDGESTNKLDHLSNAWKTDATKKSCTVLFVFGNIPPQKNYQRIITDIHTYIHTYIHAASTKPTNK